MAAGNLTRRILFSLVAIPAALGIAWLGGWWFTALIAIAAVLGLRELFDFGQAQGFVPLRVFGYLAAVAIPAGTLNWTGAPMRWSWPWAIYTAALWLIVVMVAAAWREAGKRPLASVAVTVFGVAYAAGLPSFAIALRHRLGRGVTDEPLAGTLLLFFPLVLTWIGDTAAMAGGKMIGGAKLAPTLSPNKTWAGSIAGMLGSIITALAFSLWILPLANIHVALAWIVVMAIVISIAGQVGDLSESAFKREIGVKDSSALIPGHGGVLDRFDALYFVLPVTAILYDIFLPTVR